jgi:adenylate cyclase
MKKILLSPWTAILTLIIFVGLRLWDPSFVESVRLRYFDTLITSQQKIDIPVNIVNIDEDALDKYGQFPFPRGTYADIIKELYKRNAGLVVFNVLTPEKDRFNQDGQYASVLSQTPTVIPELGSTKSKNTARTPNTMKVGQDPQGRVVEYPGILANTPQVEQVAAGVGIANTFPEIDGVVRRMPLVILSGDNLYPALALETLRVAAQDTKIQVKIGNSGVEALRIPKLSKIPTDGLSRVWIDWSQTPKEYSLAKLPNDFKGEIVIVGLSAAGLVNPVATAKGEVWPQYMQASLMGTLLNGITIQRPDWADIAEVIALVVAGIVLLFLTRWTYVGLASGIIIIGGSIPLSGYLYSSHAWLVDVTCLVSGLVLVMLHA